MNELKPSYDAVIVGAGHNGLVTAAYLAKAGLRVAVFEARHVVGGAAVTEELWPGFKISRCSYVNSLFRPEIVRDLELKKFGFEMLPRDPSSFTPFPDGRSLLMGPDAALTRSEIAKFSMKDAEAYPRYEAFLGEVASVLEPMLDMVPLDPRKPSLGALADYARLGLKKGGVLLKRWPEMLKLFKDSATDLLSRWFESEELMVTLATDAVIGANASPSQPGSSYILFHHVMGECNGVRGVWGYMRGGMGGLSESIAGAARALGVEIFLSTPVEKILVSRDGSRDGRVTGVVVSGGREVRSPIVASGVDPNVTFNRLITASELPPTFLKKVRAISYDSASVKINLALDELPEFKAKPGKEPGPHHRGTIHICPDMEYLERAYTDSREGRPSRKPFLDCSIPSVIDSTIAPPGKHVMNIFAQYGPYKLAPGLSWENERDAFADRCIDVLAEYAPNVKRAIIHREVLTPVDLEREFHLTGGNISHGAMTLDQMFNARPVPGFSGYRMPLEGLYLCGSGAHPGGGVMGAAGKNCAGVILKDRR